MDYTVQGVAKSCTRLSDFHSLHVGCESLSLLRGGITKALQHGAGIVI